MVIPQPTTGYPRTIYDAAGERIEVILDVATYEALLTALEDAEDILAYDAAKADDPDGLPFDEAVREIERMAADYEGRTE